MSQLNTQSIVFIGAGNMATAIIEGLLATGVPAENITAAEPSQDRLTAIRQRYGVVTDADNNQAVQQADVVVLCVKPQILKGVCVDLSASLPKNCLVISIAAGVELSSLQAWLGDQSAVVRCMPNTPAQVQLGASGLIANSSVSAGQKELAEALFSSVGVCSWVSSENLLHSVTALSGSGPAYGFLFISAMEQAGVTLGLSPEMARQFAAQTMLGAAKMVLESDTSPGQLKQNVMSPGGTTERAIEHFENQGLPKLVSEAMTAAYQRSIELADLAKESDS